MKSKSPRMPRLFTQGGFLAEAFPDSKLIHMVRDGRAISHSLVSREDHAFFTVPGLLKMREFLKVNLFAW